MGADDHLFGFLEDLEAQAEGVYDAERRVDLDDRSRAEYREVTLTARLAASVDGWVEVEVRGVGMVAGELVRVGEDWLQVRAPSQDWVVRRDCVQRVVGASARAVPEAARSPLGRLGVGAVLRRLADRAARCVLHRTDGTRHEVVVLRVGADFVEVAEGERRTSLVALSSLGAIQGPEL